MPAPRLKATVWNATAPSGNNARPHLRPGTREHLKLGLHFFVSDAQLLHQDAYNLAQEEAKLCRLRERLQRPHETFLAETTGTRHARKLFAGWTAESETLANELQERIEMRLKEFRGFGTEVALAVSRARLPARIGKRNYPTSRWRQMTIRVINDLAEALSGLTGESQHINLDYAADRLCHRSLERLEQRIRDLRDPGIPADDDATAQQTPPDGTSADWRTPKPPERKDTTLLRLNATDENAVNYITSNPGCKGDAVAEAIHRTSEHFRRIFSNKLRNLGFYNEGDGYFPPKSVTGAL